MKRKFESVSLKWLIGLVMLLGAGTYGVQAAGPAILTKLSVFQSISIGKNADADSKAALDIVSTTKGFLPPRMTEAQRDAISSPPTGLQVYNTDTNTMNVFNGSIWEEVGSGGGTGEGGINYVSNPHAVSDTTGWTGYDDGASATLVDGTGGTFDSELTVTTSDSEVIRDVSVESGSFKLAKDAANRQGEGVCTELLLDRVDLGTSRTQVVSFDYLTDVNGDYVSGDVKVFVYAYDDSSKVLTVLNSDNGSVLEAQNGTGVAGRFVGSFQTDNVNNEFRLCLHIATTNASAWDLIFDNVKVTPEQTVPGAIVTSWETFTPTVNWGGTATQAYKRRVGSNLEFRFNYAVSSPSASLAITLPNSLVSTLTGSGAPTVGKAYMLDAGTAIYSGSVIMQSTTQITIVGYNNGGVVHQSGNPFTWVNGDSFSVEVSVPISGWAAGAALSTTETMMMGASAALTGDPASATAGNPIILPTKRWDTLNCYNTTTGLCTVPRKAKYKIYGNVISGAAAGTTMWIYVNSTNTTSCGYLDSNGEATISCAVEANAGDTISMRQTAGTVDLQTPTNLYIEEWFDPTVFGVYGTFQTPLTFTSSTKTPTGSGNFHAMTGGTFTLTEGTWRITGECGFGNGGASPTYSDTRCQWYGVAGTDSSTPPATTLASAVTLMSPATISFLGFAGTLSPNASNNQFFAPMHIVRCASSCPLYLVPYSLQTTSANARVIVTGMAERLQ